MPKTDAKNPSAKTNGSALSIESTLWATAGTVRKSELEALEERQKIARSKAQRRPGSALLEISSPKRAAHF